MKLRPGTTFLASRASLPDWRLGVFKLPGSKPPQKKYERHDETFVLFMDRMSCLA